MRNLFVTILLALAATTGVFAKTTRLYCQMTYSWWWQDGNNAISLYAEGDNDVKNAAWPGHLMTELDATNHIWTIDIDLSGYNKIVFVRTNSDNQDEGAKTGELPLTTEIGTTYDLYTITSEHAVWGDPGCTGVWSKYSSTPTGLTSTNAHANAVKSIRNGQLVIEKNGKTYNALGVEVK